MITISRASGSARFPARFQLVLAANPCPCGNFGARDTDCTCVPVDAAAVPRTAQRPAARSGRHPAERAAHHRGAGADGATRRSTDFCVRAGSDRCSTRPRRATGCSGTPWRLNGHVPGLVAALTRRGSARGCDVVLDRALERGGITMRGYDRVLRLAWTLADLDGVDRPGARSGRPRSPSPAGGGRMSVVGVAGGAVRAARARVRRRGTGSRPGRGAIRPRGVDDDRRAGRSRRRGADRGTGTGRRSRTCRLRE